MSEKPVDEFGRMAAGAQSAAPLPDTTWIHDDPITHEPPADEVEPEDPAPIIVPDGPAEGSPAADDTAADPATGV